MGFPVTLQGPLTPQDIPLHDALLFPAKLGTTLSPEFFQISVRENVMTLAGRIQTYPPDWTGRTPLEMAMGGLYLNGSGKPTCFVCEIECRGLTGPNVDPWLRHKQLASNCLQLRRYKQEGAKPTPPGKARRRNSEGDVSDLLSSSRA